MHGIGRQGDIHTLMENTNTFTITYANDTTFVAYCHTTSMLVYVMVNEDNVYRFKKETTEGNDDVYKINAIYGKEVKTLRDAYVLTHQILFESSGLPRDFWNYGGYIVRDFDCTNDDGYEHHLYIQTSYAENSVDSKGVSADETAIAEYTELFVNTIDLLNEEELNLFGHEYYTQFSQMYFVGA